MTTATRERTTYVSAPFPTELLFAQLFLFPYPTLPSASSSRRQSQIKGILVIINANGGRGRDHVKCDGDGGKYKLSSRGRRTVVITGGSDRRKSRLRRAPLMEVELEQALTEAAYSNVRGPTLTVDNEILPLSSLLPINLFLELNSLLLAENRLTAELDYTKSNGMQTGLLMYLKRALTFPLDGINPGSF